MTPLRHPSVRVTAPAKLTLSLRVTGVREDGYHLIDAEMVSLDLADMLDIDPLDADAPARREGTISVLAPDGRRASIPLDGDNLVDRALRLAGARASVTLTKNIAPGGGLGGGSSDAAAVLRWAGFEDLEAAAGLGADIPFCMIGGRARVRGIGERIDPLPFVARTLTLWTPPFGCSTPTVYAAWDELGGPTSGGSNSESPNDLEAAALWVEPRLGDYRERLGEATGQTPCLAGSGSTWFVEGAFPGDGRVVVKTTPAYGKIPQPQV